MDGSFSHYLSFCWNKQLDLLFFRQPKLTDTSSLSVVTIKDCLNQHWLTLYFFFTFSLKHSSDLRFFYDTYIKIIPL